MRSIIFRGILAATAALAAACSSTDSVAPTTSPAAARRDVSAIAANGTSMSRPIDQYVWVSCLERRRRRDGPRHGRAAL